MIFDPYLTPLKVNTGGRKVRAGRPWAQLRGGGGGEEEEIEEREGGGGEEGEEGRTQSLHRRRKGDRCQRSECVSFSSVSGKALRFPAAFRRLGSGGITISAFF